MKESNNLFFKLKVGILAATLFLFPLFFLTTTQDFFSFNKMYLLVIAAMLLILTSVIEMVVTKKFHYSFNILDVVLFLFTLSVVISTFVPAPNKIQALLQPTFGPIVIAALSVLTFYMLRIAVATGEFLVRTLLVSVSLTSLFAIVFFFQPLKSMKLPLEMQFLQVPYFNTVGNVIDLAILLAFAVILAYSRIAASRKNSADKAGNSFYYGALAISGIGLALVGYVLIKTFGIDHSVAPYPPYRVSWNAAIETLKNPITALIGIGVNNFAAMFTQQKDVLYNLSNQWQIGSFNFAKSTILHVMVESGLFGVASMVLLFYFAFKDTYFSVEKKTRTVVLPLLFLVVAVILFPPSITLFFLIFFTVSMSSLYLKPREGMQADLHHALFVPFVGLIITLVIMGAGGYLLGRAYVAEYLFRQAVIADAKGDLQKVYDNHVQAILLNPYIEAYRISFSRVNLFIANSIYAKALKDNENSGNKKLSDKDSNNIAERIKIAIAEGKAATTLNSLKSLNWENLATIYRNILTTAQGADVWTVTAYQRAIVLDPNNPIYRLDLGGVYYTLGAYQQAQQLFGDAIQRKSDWSNAYYNYAWASYQKQDYQTAVNAMQSAITYLDPKANKTDLEKAQKELEEFKKKLPADQTKEGSESAQAQQNQQLSLPTPATASVELKLQLPKEASPEAK
jgi:hypothetical protein